MLECKLEPICTLCYSFKPIALVSTEEKQVQKLMGKWNKRQEWKKKKKELSIDSNNRVCNTDTTVIMTLSTTVVLMDNSSSDGQQ